MAMQRNYFTILFFIKKSKLLKNGEAPICMRITVNGQRAEIQIKRLYFFILDLFPFAKICVHLRFNKDLNSVELRVTLW